MPATAQEIFQRYIWAGAMTRNADALAELFTTDGIYEAPLVPTDHAFPSRLDGREEIRKGMAAYYRRPSNADGTVNVDKSRYVLHATTDPDVFIAEIDTAIESAGQTTTMSLVQIFRVRDDKIALLRDYFAPQSVS